jgi:hypothetical protein
VVLDTVELVLCPSSASPADADPRAEGGEAEAGGSWLGSALQSLAVRAGLNMSITLRNVVIKYVSEPDFVASISFQEAALATCAAAEWRHLLRNPEAWLKKECFVQGLSVCMDPLATDRTFAPVLRASRLRVAALLPIFSYVERTDLDGDDFKVSVSVEVDPIDVAVNDRQLAWAGELMQLLAHARPAPAAAYSLQTSVLAAPAEPTSPAAPRPRARASSKDDMKALGIFGRIWDYVADEATYLDSLDDGGGTDDDGGGAAGDIPPAEQVVYAELDATLCGLQITLGVVRVEAPQAAEQQGSGGAASPEVAQLEANRLQQLAETLEQLQHITSAADAAVVQQQLLNALEAQPYVSPSGQRQAAPVAVVHPLLELELAGLKLRTTSAGSAMQSAGIELVSLSVRRNISCAQLAADVLDPWQCGAAAWGAQPACWDEVFGLHYMQPAQSASSARQSSPRTPAAFQAKWYAAGQGGGGLSSSAGQRCAVQVGQVWVAYAPGLATTLAQLVQPLTRSAESASAPDDAAASPEPGSAEGGSGQLARWLRSGTLMNVDLGALQLAALSSQHQHASAALLTLSHLQCHSGALNWSSSWNASLRQALLSPEQGYPGQGFRVSVGGVTTLVAAGTWHPQASRAGGLDVLGCVPVSNRSELRGVVSAEVHPYQASLALQPLELHLSGQQLGAVAAALAGLAAERVRGWRHCLPAPALLEAAAGPDGRAAHWVAGLRVRMGAVQVVYGGENSLQHIAGAAQRAVGAGPDVSRLHVRCSAVSAAVEAVAPEGSVAATLSLELSDLQAWALPGWAAQLGLAALDVDVPGEGRAAASGAEPLLLATDLGASSSDQASSWRGSSVALACRPATAAAAVALLRCTAGRAALPPHPGYPEPPQGPLERGGGEDGELRESSSSAWRPTSYTLDMASFTVYPPLDGSAEGEGEGGQGVVGVAGWASRLEFRQPAPSQDDFTVGSMELELCRPLQGASSGGPLSRSTVLRCERCCARFGPASPPPPPGRIADTRPGWHAWAQVRSGGLLWQGGRRNCGENVGGARRRAPLRRGGGAPVGVGVARAAVGGAWHHAARRPGARGAGRCVRAVHRQRRRCAGDCAIHAWQVRAGCADGAAGELRVLGRCRPRGGGSPARAGLARGPVAAAAGPGTRRLQPALAVGQLREPDVGERLADERRGESAARRWVLRTAAAACTWQPPAAAGGSPRRCLLCAQELLGPTAQPC